MVAIVTCFRWHLIVVLICISLMTSNVEHPFCAYWPSAFSHWQNACSALLLFLINLLMVSCMSLYILDINFLFLISHFICKYFLLFSSLPFHFVMVSFTVQKLLSSIRSYFLIFAFISFTLGDIPKTNITIIYDKDCSAYIFLYEFYNIRSYI